MKPQARPFRRCLRHAAKTIIRTHLPALLGLLIAATAAGCKKAPETAPAVPPPAAPIATTTWPAKRQTDRGNFTVTIQPEGGGITRNQHFSLSVLVEPGAGAATPASVTVDADMPSHGHGMNTKAETLPESGPRYRANGLLFHMAGEWSIIVDISAGGAQERALFPVVIE